MDTKSFPQVGIASTDAASEHGKRAARKNNLLICAGLVLLTLVCYGQVCNFGLIALDDADMVTYNPRVMAGLSWDNIRWAFTTDYLNFRMPMVWMSYMLDGNIRQFAEARGWQIGPDNMGILHVTNLAMHLASTVVLFVVLYRLTKREWRCAFVAALFALHPLHVESVAWVTERKDVLSGLFWVLTMLAYERYTRRENARSYALLIVVFVLGLLAKPMLVTLPVILLMLDYWPLGRLGRRAVIEKIPLLALVVVASVLAYISQDRGGALPSLSLYPMSERIPNVVLSYVVYLQKMVWPEGLAPHYPHPLNTSPVAYVVGSAALLTAMTLLSLRFARTRPYVIVGWLWYVVSLIPVIGLVQIGSFARADRFTYVPLVGIFVIVAWGLPELLAGRLKRVLKVAACAVVVAMLVLCYRQVGYWRSDAALFGHMLRAMPGNLVAYNSLGIGMLRNDKPEQALRYFRKVIALAPDHYEALANMGCAYEALKDYDRAIEAYEAAISSNPNEARTYAVLGRVLGTVKRYPEAVKSLEKAVKLDPGAAGAWNDLGRALQLSGDDDRAKKCFERELKVHPQNADARMNLGMLLLKDNDLKGAISQLRQAVKLMPDWHRARVKLAETLVADGQMWQAGVQFRAAVKLNKKDVASANALAWILATSPRSRPAEIREAVRVAELSCAMADDADASALDTLAAAYARASRFDEAVETAGRALELARAAKQEAAAEQIRKRLALFRERRPYVEAE